MGRVSDWFSRYWPVLVMLGITAGTVVVFALILTGRLGQDGGYWEQLLLQLP